MELRWLETYDENGISSSKTLQYWNSAYKEWFDIESVRCRFDDNETINKSPFFLEEKMIGR